MRTIRVRLLLVEDDAEDAAFLLEALAHTGPYHFTTEWCDTLEVASRRLRETRFDVVLTDLNVGPHRGIETLLALRQRHPEIPIVVLSGIDDAATAVLALKSGAQDFLVKEHAHRELVTRSIAYAMERHRIEWALRRRTDELSSFTYAVTHDLRTPLISIDFLIEEVKDRLGSTDATPEVAGLLDAISDRIGSMESLIQDIHALARADEGECNELVDLARVAHEVWDDLATLIKERGLRVEADLNALPPVRGNHTQLRQLLANLLGNAAKYADDDDGHVTLQARPLGPHGTNGWRVQVEDNGPGVAPEHRDRIFQAFERVPDPFGRDIPGTGIGLAIAAKVAHIHDTWIHVGDRPGGGARFWFDLPPGRIVARGADAHGHESPHQVHETG